MARGLGHVYLRGETWWIKYYVDGEAKYESSESTKKTDATNLLKARLNNPSGPVAGKTTVGDLLDDLVEFYKTYRPKSYPRFCKPLVEFHLKPFFGAMKPNKISIKEYVAERQKEDAANGSINRELSLLRKAFVLGKEAKPPKVNFAPTIHRLQEAKPRKGFLEPEQYRKLLEALPPELKPVLVVGYHTGLRRAKVLGLRLDQIDLTKKKIYMDPEDGETTKHVAKVIPIYGDMIEWIERQVAETRVKLPACPWLFHRADGSPIVDFRDPWATATEEIGMKGLLFHDLRRSAVRNMVRAGVPQAVAMSISGHKTPSVFERYNIINEADIENAGAMLDTYLNGGAKSAGAGA